MTPTERDRHAARLQLAAWGWTADKLPRAIYEDAVRRVPALLAQCEQYGEHEAAATLRQRMEATSG